MSEETSAPVATDDLADEFHDIVDDDLDDLDLEIDPREATDLEGPAPDIVVFDIGEVLIDETRVWGIWADILGVSRFTFAAVLGAAIAQGEDHEVVFPHVAPNTEWREFEGEHERRYGGFREEDVYSDVRLCLSELQAMDVRVGIVGNQPARRHEQLLALDLPHDVLATSDELMAAKPDPAFFAAVQKLVGAQEPSQVLYVGDRVDNDVLPAMAFGMRTCWLRRGPWGHLQALPDDVEADLVLDGLGELPLLLQGWREEEHG
jgi:HAD superfamily hydrolase (TIGR01549 family)